MPLETGKGWRERRIAFGRAILYAVAAAACALAGSALLKVLYGRTFLDLAHGSPGEQLIGKLLFAIALVVLPTAFLLRLTGEPIACSGWAPSKGLKLFGCGLLAGLVLMAVLVLELIFFAGATIGSAGAPRLTGALTGMALWLTVGFLEEGSDRGYLLVQLSRALSFWPAALATSAWFMIGHSPNAGESWFGIAAAGSIGLVLAYSFRRTGSLWFAAGFHGAWDFAESWLFGLPNSGAMAANRLMRVEMGGSTLLTGGPAGPEASLLVLPVILLLVMVLRFAIAATPQPTATRAD